MVAVAVIATLIGRVAILVNGRPFTDSFALIGTNTPILPIITLPQFATVHRIVGKVNRYVIVKTCENIV